MISAWPRTVLVFLSCCLVAGPPAFPAVPPPPAAVSGEEVRQLIQQLGDDDFKVREKASAALWAAGKAAEKPLEEAAKSPDFEVARRAKDILDKFKLGIYPDTPAEVVKLIRTYRAGDPNTKESAIKDLLKHGRPGFAALQRLAAAEADPGARQNLAAQIGTAAGEAAASLLAAGDFAGAGDVLEVTLAGGGPDAFRNYAAFQFLNGRLDDAIRRYKAKADQGPDKQPAEVLAYLYRARGDLKNALAAAGKAGKAELVRGILFELGDWKGLKKVLADQQDSGFTPGVRATIDRLTGDTAASDAALTQVAGQKESDAYAVLFFNDRPDQAVAALSTKDGRADAFEFLALQLKFREAFELADKAEKLPPQERFPLDLMRARTLAQLGEKAKARKVFSDLVAGLKDTVEFQHGSVVEAEYQAGLKDDAFAHCARFLAAAKDDGARSRLLGRVFPQSSEAADVWWKFFRGEHPTEEPAATLNRLRGLLDDHKTGPDFTSVVRAAEKAAEGMSADEREPWLRALADTCQSAGKDELSEDLLAKAAQASGTPDSWLRLGDFLAGKKRWAKAERAYQKAWAADQKRPVALYLRGWVLTHSGQAEEGRQLMERARWLPLADARARWALGEALARHGLTEAALRERDLIRTTGEFQSVYVTNVRNLEGEAAFARKDYDQAAVCAEAVLLTVLQAHLTFVKNRAYLMVPANIHRNRALAHLKAGRVEGARKEVALALTCLPGDIDLAVQFVGRFAARGQEKDAAEVFDKAFALHTRLCTDYPNSGWCHNNLAWLTARCRRQLDVGLEHARKAVELAPQNAGHLDTLAEVRFQRGERAEAVELMKKCVELEPKHEYFRKQLRRFETGDPKTDPPTEG